MNTVYKIRLIKGDTVVVLTGKDKGKTGKVIATHPKDNTVTVECLNMFKKHLKPNKQHPQGGIIDITKPIDVSKVAILEPTTKKPSRIGFIFDKDGNRKRVYKSTGKEIK